MTAADLMQAALSMTERDLIEAIIAETFFADYGYVTAVIPAIGDDKTRVDIQHIVKPKVVGQDLPPTVTRGVELLFPAGAGYSEEWDVKKGDGVLLIGLKWYVNTVDQSGPQSSDVNLHYTQETMKAIPLGRFNGSATVTLKIIGGKWQLNATEIDLNGDSKRFVTHAELDTALQGLMTSLNSHTHLVASLGAPTGPASTSVPPITFSIDISAAKTTTVKTGG